MNSRTQRDECTIDKLMLREGQPDFLFSRPRIRSLCIAQRGGRIGMSRLLL